MLPVIDLTSTRIGTTRANTRSHDRINDATVPNDFTSTSKNDDQGSFFSSMEFVAQVTVIWTPNDRNEQHVQSQEVR